MDSNEEKLIEKIKIGDDQALEQLFNLYQPLVNKIIGNFYLPHYERKDWEQEAMIVCYETALVYSAEKGRFASLYKTKLSNHARTLVRYNLAKRRQGANHILPLENAKTGMVNEPKVSELAIPINETYNNFVNSLSYVELVALLTIIGKISIEYAVENFEIKEMQLMRAKSRILQKMRDVLF